MANGTAEAAAETEVQSLGTSTDFEATLDSWRQAVLDDVSGSQEEPKTETEVEETPGSSQTPQTEETPNEQDEATETDAEEERPLSRREAFRLAEQRQKQLQEAEEANKKLTDDLAARTREEEELAKDVQAALGTDDEYKRLTALARAGNVQAGRALDQIDANRAFYGKLVQRAGKDIQSFFTSKLVDTATKMGIETETLMKGTPAAIVEAAYKAGSTAKEAELGARIEELEAALKGQKVSGVSRRNGAALSGGRSAANQSAMDDWFNPDGATLKEEAIEAARNGRLTLN